MVQSCSGAACRRKQLHGQRRDIVIGAKSEKLARRTTPSGCACQASRNTSQTLQFDRRRSRRTGAWRQKVRTTDSRCVLALDGGAAQRGEIQKFRCRHQFCNKYWMGLLKNLDPLLTADLLYVLRSMGHGDMVCVCDCNFPAAEVASKTTTGKLVILTCDLPSVWPSPAPN
jgi:hypothetical protein